MDVKVSQDQIERIREATNIVDLVSEHVRLKKRGRNFIGLCPFHNEKTPSFNVLEDRGIYKCFGCGKGGDAFSFVMQMEGLTFPEAIKKLAERAHIEIDGTETEAEDAARGHRELIYHVLRESAAYYYRTLRTPMGEDAQAYLRSRKLRDEILKKFGLGYAPDSGLLVQHLKKLGIELELAEQAGLVARRDSGEYYERFRGRVIFPVFNKTGRIIGLGGRILPSSEKKSGSALAKYINSPDTEVYHKSQILYGLFQAKDAIRKAGFAILVEGYADVLAVFQAGIENVVAASGTSLTVEQLELLRHYTTDIVLLFDADKAGKNATVRGIELAVEAGFDVSTVVLPSGEDPDSFIRLNGSLSFQNAIEHRQTFIEAKTQILEEQGAFRDPGTKARAIESIIETIRRVPNDIKQQLYLQKLSEQFDLPFSILSTELARQTARNAYSNNLHKSSRERPQEGEPPVEPSAGYVILHPSSLVRDPAPFVSRYEEGLLKALLANPIGVSHVIENFDFNFDSIKYLPVKELIGYIVQRVQDGNPPSVSSLLDEYRYNAGYNDLLVQNTVSEDSFSSNWEAPLEESSHVAEAEQILFAIVRRELDEQINQIMQNEQEYVTDKILVETNVIMRHPAMVQRHTQTITKEDELDD